MAELKQIDALLISREWRDEDDGVGITLWARAQEGPVRAHFSRQEAVMFVPRHVATHAGRRVPKELRTLRGEPVDAVYFRSRRALVEERDRLRDVLAFALESDVKPSDRYLMERFITGSLTFRGRARERRGVLVFDDPQVRASDFSTALSLLAVDIETDGLGGPLLSAAVAGPAPESEQVFLRRDTGDERVLLRRLFEAIVRADPDVLCGWNVTEFDLAVLDARARALGVPFTIGRGGERARVVAGAPGRASIARVPGRVVLDGIATLKSATHTFERYTLDHVARELTGRGKKIKSGVDPVAEIRRLHDEEPAQLAEYNLEDCRLVLAIFDVAGLLPFAVERARLTGLPMDRPGGSVAAFDHLYLPRIHRRGVVAPDVDTEVDVVPSPGGHVLDSVPGLYRDVLSFDFRSLYPSIIRTFRVDPLGLFFPGDDPVPGEDGATFARDGAILPELIATLHEARSAAMAAGNTALSRAIKILMNSFYGVLGTPGCRFFDPRLPTSITRRGHAIIERARAFFEAEGLPILYGDTDSLFAHWKDAPGEAQVAARGKELAARATRLFADEIARAYRLESHLELRFESHYLRFVMPTTRGSDRGSKKRYAGTVRTKDGGTRLVVRGLEAVRRDWTPLARRAQLELLRRVCADEPYEEWLLGLAKDLAAGRLDDELALARRVRREDGEGKVDVVTVMTTRGPEPPDRLTAPIDLEHYRDKQLAPACDVVLGLVGTSFAKVAGAQTTLF